MNEEWHWCHDFLYGFGYCKNFDSSNPSRIWLRDLESLLGITSFEGLDFEETYTKLQPLILERLEKRRKYAEEHPFKFEKITIPKVNKEYPKL